MGDYVAEHVGVSHEEADRLRQNYWLRYGATLLGLVRHHGVRAAHFLDQTHRLPGLEERLRTSTHDRAALAAPARPQVRPHQRAARLCDARADDACACCATSTASSRSRT